LRSSLDGEAGSPRGGGRRDSIAPVLAARLGWIGRCEKVGKGSRQDGGAHSEWCRAFPEIAACRVLSFFVVHVDLLEGGSWSSRDISSQVRCQLATKRTGNVLRFVLLVFSVRAGLRGLLAITVR
jgi:hypothetical protein